MKNRLLTVVLLLSATVVTPQIMAGERDEADELVAAMSSSSIRHHQLQTGDRPPALGIETEEIDAILTSKEDSPTTALVVALKKGDVTAANNLLDDASPTSIKERKDDLLKAAKFARQTGDAWRDLSERIKDLTESPSSSSSSSSTSAERERDRHESKKSSGTDKWSKMDKM